MTPTVFIARAWSRTWIHEGRICVWNSVDDPSIWESYGYTVTSVCPDHISFSGDAHIGKMLFGKKEYSNNKITNRHGISMRVVYMDDAYVCPFCGKVQLSRYGVDWGARQVQWEKLHRIGNLLSFADLSVVESIAKINNKTPEYRFRMCSKCRKQSKNPIRASSIPRNGTHLVNFGLNWDALPYEKVAASIESDKDRLLWWETKLICHGRRIAKTSAPSVKKAIERRLRRKRLTIAEHKALSVMLAPSIIKQRLKSA